MWNKPFWSTTAAGLRQGLNSLQAAPGRLVPQALRGRVLMALLLAFVAGILLASRLRPDMLWAGLVLAVSGLLIVVLAMFRRSRRWQIFLIAAAALGFFYCAGEYAALDAWPAEQAKDGVLVSGTVRGAANLRADERWSVRLQVEQLDGEAIHCADIYVYGEGTVPRSGSRIELYGTAFSSQPYGNANAFDYQAYLRQNGIAGQIGTYYGGWVNIVQPGPAFSLASIGAWLRDCMAQAAEPLTERQKTLVYGVFLGEKSGLEPGLREALSLSGMMHAFAVSGLHVGYVVMLALLLAGSGFARRKQRFLLTICFLLVYLSVTGLAASIVRASIMAVVLLVAELCREEQDSLTTLSLAAWACLLLHPLWLFSAGFLLSFAAMWGIVVLEPLFRQLLPAHRFWLRSGATTALAATLATLPLVCYYFYHISWLGWLLSPLVVLAAQIAVVLCFVALPLAVFLPAVAGWLLQAAGFVLELLAAAAEAVSALPIAAQVTGAVSVLAVLLFYGALLLLPFLLRRFGKWPVLGFLLLILLLFSYSPKQADLWQDSPLATPSAAVVFIDVGQGDAALLMDTAGRTILVDGGGKRNAPGEIGQYTLLPYLKSLGITEIDLLISSHPDTDHMDGLLSVLQQLKVGTLLYAAAFAENEENQALLAAAEENGCAVWAASTGFGCTLGQFRLCVYSPAESGYYADENDASLVVEISVGDVDFLFTGDASGDTLAALQGRYDLEAEVVKMPHHGSKTGYNERFYEALLAEAVVFCVGAENSYGHPAANVLEYWQDQAAGIYRTDEQGAITFWTDGAAWAAKTQK